jgi:hypothetical protein
MNLLCFRYGGAIKVNTTWVLFPYQLAYQLTKCLGKPLAGKPTAAKTVETKLS